MKLTLADDLVVQARAGEPLLNSLERAGVPVPAICRSGCCGSCRTKVVQGDMVQATPRRPSDDDAGFVNACVSFPVSDATLRVPGEGSQRRQPEASPGEEAASGEVTGAAGAGEQPSPGDGKRWINRVVTMGGLASFSLLVGSAGMRPEAVSRVGWSGFFLLLLLSLAVFGIGAGLLLTSGSNR